MLWFQYYIKGAILHWPSAFLWNLELQMRNEGQLDFLASISTFTLNGKSKIACFILNAQYLEIESRNLWLIWPCWKGYDFCKNLMYVILLGKFLFGVRLGSKLVGFHPFYRKCPLRMAGALGNLNSFPDKQRMWSWTYKFFVVSIFNK